MSTEQLEHSLTGLLYNSDDEINRFETNSFEISGKARQMILKYLSCCKAFDSSQINADVATSLCSICNKLFRSNKFPAYGMGNAKSNDADEIDTVDLK